MLPAAGRQHRGCIIPQTVTHSLVLLKMGKIISRNMFELTGIIKKPLLLHLVGCLYYLYQWCTIKQISDNEIYLLIKYIKSVLWRVAECLSYIEESRCLKFNWERWSSDLWRDVRRQGALYCIESTAVVRLCVLCIVVQKIFSRKFDIIVYQSIESAHVNIIRSLNHKHP